MAPRKRKPAAAKGPPAPKKPRARKPAASRGPVEAAEVIEAEPAEEVEASGPAALDEAEIDPPAEELAAVDAEFSGSDGERRAPRPAARTAAIVPVGDRSVARKDVLQAYMAEVARHPLLTREEEHAL